MRGTSGQFAGVIVVAVVMALGSSGAVFAGWGADQFPQPEPEREPATEQEVPRSIVGTWVFDMERTMEDFLDKLRQHREAIAAGSRPATESGSEVFDLRPQPQVRADMTSSPAGARAAGTPLLVIDDTHIVFHGTGLNGPMKKKTAYKIVGGNARLLMLEAQDEAQTAVMNVRLVPGGLAVESTDCRRQTEACAEMYDQPPATQISGPDPVTGEFREVQVSPRVPAGHESGIKWVYFKRAADSG